MCLIVFKEDEKSVFTNRQFKNMIRRNRHGLGIMYRENGRVIVEKTVSHERDKFTMWQKHRDKQMYAMHARLTTHGETNLANCHPYKIMSIDDGDPIDLYMMHNGVIHNAPEIDKKMSDTWHFAEYVIKPIVRANLDLLWDNEEFQAWLSKTIGGSKLLFMRSDDIENPVLILNAGAGEEQNGCWLSNAYSTNTSHVNYNRNTTNRTNHNYNGGTQSTRNPTTPLNRNNGTTVIMAGKTGNNEVPWNEFVAAQRINKTPSEQQRERTARLFLPNSNESAKIIELNPSDVKLLPHYEDPNQHLYEIVSSLQGLSTHLIKDWVREDPDLTADVILALYDKNTMPYELIIQQIQDDAAVDGIVDIIRHIVSFKATPKAIRN